MRRRDLLFIPIYLFLLTVLTAVTFITGSLDARMVIAFCFCLLSALVAGGSLLLRCRYRRDGVLYRLPSILVTHVYFGLCYASAFCLNLLRMLIDKIPDRLILLSAKLELIKQISSPGILITVYLVLTAAVVLFLAIEFAVNRSVLRGENQFEADKSAFSRNILALEELRTDRTENAEISAIEALLEKVRYSPVAGNESTRTTEERIELAISDLRNLGGDAFVQEAGEIAKLVEKRNLRLKNGL